MSRTTSLQGKFKNQDHLGRETSFNLAKVLFAAGEQRCRRRLNGGSSSDGQSEG